MEDIAPEAQERIEILRARAAQDRIELDQRLARGHLTQAEYNAEVQLLDASTQHRENEIIRDAAAQMRRRNAQIQREERERMGDTADLVSDTLRVFGRRN